MIARAFLVVVVIAAAAVAMAALAGETPTLAVDRLVYQAPAAAESADVVSPAVSTVIVVASPTPGPDWSATRAAIEIQAAADRAAGDQAYRLAGEAELTRQWSAATAEAGLATATAQHVATLSAIEAHATQQALALAAAADRATATRSAVLAATVQHDQDLARAHVAALDASERTAEMRRQRAQEWVRPLVGITGPFLVFALAVSAGLLVLRLALARDLADDLIAVVERVTGNFAPLLIEGEAVPVLDPAAPAAALGAGDSELAEFLRYALGAGSYCYDPIRAAGWAHGARSWQRHMERLTADGWAIKVSNGRGGQKYIERGNNRRIIDALSHYVGTPLPRPVASGAVRGNGSRTVP